MAASILARVNPTLVAWARNESGYDADVVAKRLGVPVTRLLSWERGESQPTVRQTQELARRYRRPFGVFFLPLPPPTTPLAAVLRRLPGISSGAESPEFRLAVRLMLLRREATLQLAGEMGVQMPQFVTAARLTESSRAVGQRLRKLLGVAVDEQLAWRDEWEAWRTWRAAVESAGILVFQFPRVELQQVRGLSLLEFPLPAIGINSKELSPAARSYTLLHEVAHVALAVGHAERVARDETRSDGEWGNVERFADEVASEALIPEAALRPLLEKRHVVADAWDLRAVRSMASRFRVTPLAMATRLRAVGAMNWSGYRAWRADWDNYVAALKPRTGGPTTPVERAINRGGRQFAQLVVEALDANRITAVDACNYLELRFDHFDNLRRELRHGSSGRAGADSGD